MKTSVRSIVIAVLLGGSLTGTLPAQTSLNYLNVTNYGAVGDGATDCTAAFQAAIAAAQASSNNGIYVPMGKYVISASLTLSQIEMMGKFAGGWPADTMPMPTLLIQNLSTPGVILQAGASLHGVSLEYNNGSPTTTNAPAVSLQGEGITISSLRIQACYDGITTPSASVPNRARLTDIFIDAPVHAGLQISKVTDFVQCQHIEVWCPSAFSTGPAYSFGAITGGSFNGLTAFQCTPGMQISTDTSPGGGTFTGTLTDCSFDACTTGLNISGNHQVKVIGGDWDCENYGIVLNGANAMLSVVGGKWHANSAQGIDVQLAQNVIISGCMFYQSVNESNPLVWISSCTTATVDSCQFLTGNGLQLDNGVQRAIVTGNIFQSGTIVNNMTSTNKIVGNNLFP